MHVHHCVVGTAVFGLVARLPTRASFIAVCLALRLIEGKSPTSCPHMQPCASVLGLLHVYPLCHSAPACPMRPITGWSQDKDQS